MSSMIPVAIQMNPIAHDRTDGSPIATRKLGKAVRNANTTAGTAVSQLRKTCSGKR